MDVGEKSDGRLARTLPRKARFLQDARAAGRQGRARNQPVRRAEARGAAAALRPAPAVRRRAQELGGAQRALARPQSPAARGACRRPPARVCRLRGPDPEGSVRRRGDDRVGPGHLDPDGRPGGGLPQGQPQVPPRRREARRWLDPRAPQAQGGRARRQLAADQGARSVRTARIRCRDSGGAARERDQRPPGRAACRAGAAGQAGATTRGGRALVSQGCQESAAAEGVPAAAGHAGVPGARGRGVAARDQVRRLPHDRPHRWRRGEADHPIGPRLDRPLRRARQGLQGSALRAGADRRRDRGPGRVGYRELCRTAGCPVRGADAGADLFRLRSAVSGRLRSWRGAARGAQARARGIA